MFAYQCPTCRQRLLALPSRVGQRSICPKCLLPLTIPSPEQVPVAGPFVPAPTPVEPIHPIAVDEPAPGGGQDTPAPINTMPARTGKVPKSEREAAVTVPFLDLAPAVDFDPPDEHPAAGSWGGTPRPEVPPAHPKRRTDEHDGRVAFDSSTSFAGDTVAQPSAAISMRMAPPPLPNTDRTYAIIGWVVGTLVGIGVWVLGVWQSADWLPYVAFVGGVMAAFGVLWRAYLSSRAGSWVSGLATLLPPVCVVQLVRPVVGVGLRPLWFVLSGVGLFGLFLTGGQVKRWVADTFEPAGWPTTLAEEEDLDAVAARLEHRADRARAKAVLVRAGQVAEPAVRKLLTSRADGTVMTACDVLAEIGTADTVPVLRKLADDTSSKAVRIEAATAADAIEKRLAATD